MNAKYQTATAIANSKLLLATVNDKKLQQDNLFPFNRVMLLNHYLKRLKENVIIF